MRNIFVILFFNLLLQQLFAQDLQVIETYPETQYMMASPTDEILITFNEAPDMMTINEGTFRVFGKWSGPMEGSFTLDTSTNTVIFSSERPLFYGEWVSVRLSP